MQRRYARAVELTAPRMSAKTPGLVVDGYWVDDRRYFFLEERFDPGLDAVQVIPTLVDCSTRRIAEVVPVGELLSLLSSATGTAADARLLSLAQFDMPRADLLAVTLNGKEFLIDVPTLQVTQVHPALVEPALFSPDGSHACVARGHDLWLKERKTGLERALTSGGTRFKRYGQQPETCLAALSYRKCPRPMGLWSRDSEWVLTHVIDEHSVPGLPLVQHVPPQGGRPISHQFKHCLPDDPLPTARYVAIHIKSGQIIEFPESAAPVMTYSPFYLRMAWFNDDDTASFVRFDRYRRQVDLVSLDLVRHTTRVLLCEKVCDGYIDLNPMYFKTPNIRVLSASREIIWFSECDGWGHLYLYDADTGRIKNQITRGNWVVRDIVWVDEARRKILFLAGGVDPEADPLRRCLCSISLDGTGFTVVSAYEGDTYVPPHEPAGLGQERPFRPSYRPAGVSPGGRYALVRQASMERGNTTSVLELATHESLVMRSIEPDQESVVTRAFTALAADGVTRLYGRMFMPSDFDEQRRYPLIDHIYPGPQFPHQPQAWCATQSAPAMALAELGFITVMLDTRGVPGRDRSFHQLGYGGLLEPQLSDHAAVVKQLCERHGFIDNDRVGIIGWSAGGAAAARALFDYGALYKAGVSVCGNHDPGLHSTGWSDRYRGPRDPASWSRQANESVAHRLSGRLLLISGDMDENVHVSQTLSLANALIRANKDFELLIIPNAGHDVLITNGYAQRRAWDFLVRHLLNRQPPENFQIVYEPREIARYELLAMREFRQ